MKRAVLLSVLLLSVAGYVYLQTSTPRPNVARLMPAGALVYLEAANFGRLLRDWNQSAIKQAWLDSDNYEQFARSNLFEKLHGLYAQYGAAAGFLPDLNSLLGVAGAESALALYEIREVEFLYISRVGQAQVARTQLWALRDKFERREAAGATFYLRTDPATNRTVAFAFANGYLLVATRDDLVARALGLLAASGEASLASERWYQSAVAAASTPGELRLLLKLESLVESVHFRSYWIQRNTSAVRQYWTGIADVTRSSRAVTETRVFLRRDDTPAEPQRPVASVLAFIPPQAGVYKAFGGMSSRELATLVVQKVIAPPMQAGNDWRFAPGAVSPDDQAGAEGDLEVRIDESPLPPDAGVSESVTAVDALLANAEVQSALLAQSTAAAGGPFVRTPAVIVLAAARDWDAAALRRALSSATGSLWSTAEVGTAWVPTVAGSHQIEKLNGLGPLFVSQRGNLLFLANDANLLTAALDGRPGAQAAEASVTYAAGFRHARERANFLRVMSALDSYSESVRLFRFGNNAAPFFSGNLGSLSRLLASAAEVRVTRQVEGPVTKESVVYLLTP